MHACEGLNSLPGKLSRQHTRAHASPPARALPCRTGGTGARRQGRVVLCTFPLDSAAGRLLGASLGRAASMRYRVAGAGGCRPDLRGVEYYQHLFRVQGLPYYQHSTTTPGGEGDPRPLCCIACFHSHFHAHTRRTHTRSTYRQCSHLTSCCTHLTAWC